MKNNLLRKTINVFVTKLGSLVSLFFISVLVANKISSESAGYYFLLFGFGNLAAVVIRYGQDIPILRVGNIVDVLIYSLKNSIILWVVFCICALVISDTLFSFLENSDELKIAFYILLINVLFTCINFLCNTYIQGNGFTLVSSFNINILPNIVTLTILIIDHNLTITKIFCANLFGTILGLLFGAFVIFFITKNEMSTKINKESFKKESSDYFIQSIISSLVNYQFVYLSGISSATNAANFSIANRISNATNLPFIALNHVLVPVLRDKITKNEINEIKRIHLNSSLIGGSITSIIYILYQFIKQNILEIYGIEYSEMLDVLDILLLGVLVTSLFGPAGIILSMNGESRYLLKLGMYTGLAQISLSLLVIFIFNLNFIYLAYVSALGLTIKNIASYFRIQQILYKYD